MKQISLSAFIVLSLISIDATISMAYANENVVIYKVTKVSKNGKLQLRAWPSPKSRIKVSLPHNAVDLTDTGKEKMLGNTKWLEVQWKNNQGWVNSRYLTKTGVLPGRRKASTNNVASTSSRNINSTTSKVTKNTFAKRESSSNEIPQMPTENRYSHPTQLQPVAKEVKTSYSASLITEKEGKILSCIGSSPSQWSITMDMANKKMRVKSQDQMPYYVPINYHSWASPNKVRMNIGGDKGRNLVDVNLEKTNACSTGLSRKNYLYEVNATINRKFFTGCCEAISN